MERLKQLKLSRSQAAEAYSISMGFTSPNDLYRLRFTEQKKALSQFECKAEVVAELCVVKNLPSGDPCWMSEYIMRYI
jgi:hypothetical protein